MDSARPIISIENKKSFWVSIFGSGLDGCNHQMTYRNSLLSFPPGGTYLFQPHLRRGGDLFNLAKAMVSLLHKELEYKVEKHKYKKLEVMQPRINNKSELRIPVGE